MYRNFKSSFIIGLNLTRRLTFNYTISSPKTIFQTRHLISYGRFGYGHSSKCLRLPFNPNGISRLISISYCIKYDFKSWALILFHPNRCHSFTCINPKRSIIQQCGQFKCTLESTKFICPHFLLIHFSTTCIQQCHHMFTIGFHPNRIIQLIINNPRIADALPRTINCTIGKQID